MTRKHQPDEILAKLARADQLKRYLTQRDVCAELNISPTALYRWRHWHATGKLMEKASTKPQKTTKASNDRPSRPRHSPNVRCDRVVDFALLSAAQTENATPD